MMSNLGLVTKQGNRIEKCISIARLGSRFHNIVSKPRNLNNSGSEHTTDGMVLCWDWSNVMLRILGHSRAPELCQELFTPFGLLGGADTAELV